MYTTSQRSANPLRRKRQDMATQKRRESTHRRNGRSEMGSHQLQQLDICTHNGQAQSCRTCQTHAQLRNYKPASGSKITLSGTLRGFCQRNGYGLQRVCKRRYALRPGICNCYSRRKRKHNFQFLPDTNRSDDSPRILPHTVDSTQRCRQRHRQPPAQASL